MRNQKFSRRNFLRDSALGAAAASTAGAAVGAALANPAAAAAHAVDVKPSDLPDFTIKEVKVYVVDLTNLHKLNSWKQARSSRSSRTMGSKAITLWAIAAAPKTGSSGQSPTSLERACWSCCLL